MFKKILKKKFYLIWLIIWLVGDHCMNFIVTQIKKLSFVQYSLADRTVQFICIPEFRVASCSSLRNFVNRLVLQRLWLDEAFLWRKSSFWLLHLYDGFELRKSISENTKSGTINELIACVLLSLKEWTIITQITSFCFKIFS